MNHASEQLSLPEEQRILSNVLIAVSASTGALERCVSMTKLACSVLLVLSVVGAIEPWLNMS